MRLCVAQAHFAFQTSRQSVPRCGAVLRHYSISFPANPEQTEMEDFTMTTINLKDLYYWYTQDQLIEVSDEVAEVFKADARYEMATSGGSPGTRRSILWTAMTGLSIPLAYMSRPRRSSLNEWKPFFVCGTLSILCRRSKAAELMHISFLASRLRKLPRPRAYMRSLFASRSSVALNA